MGTKQLVVHDALDTTTCLLGSYSCELTPITKVASTSDAGAETMTRLAPSLRWAAALSLVVNSPVASMTTSTPRTPHGRALGSRSASTVTVWPSITMWPSSTCTSASRRPWVES